MNGDFHDIKAGLAEYMARWYAGLYADTPALAEYTARGLGRSVMFAADRMVDAAEDMLASYRKNNNEGSPGANSLFPVVLVGIAKDYMPTGGDWGGQHTQRRLVAITDEVDASCYGYRQSMADLRAQIVIFAADSNTARSIASQLVLFASQNKNRRFTYAHKFGQYELAMPVMIENPDLLFSNIPVGDERCTCFACDLTLKVTIPYLDAPRDGELNDGSGRNPPGYPLVGQVNVIDHVARVRSEVTEVATTWVEYP